MAAATCSRSRAWTRRFLGSIDIALKKAKTSVLFNASGEGLWEYCKPGVTAPATEGTSGGLTPAIETLVKQVQERAWTLRTNSRDPSA